MTNTFCQIENTGAATCYVAGAGIEITSADVDSAALHRQLSDITSADTYPDLVARLAPLCAATAARSVVLFESAQETGAEASISTLFGEPDAYPSAFRETLCAIAQRVATEGRTDILTESGGDAIRFTGWSVPGQTPLCLIAAFDQGTPIPAAATFTLQAMALQIATWHIAQRAAVRETAARHLAALSELLSRLQSARTVRAACRLLANELQIYLGCQQVVVGLCRDGSTTCRVEAISDVDAFHYHNEEVRIAQAAMQETIVRGDLAQWPPRNATNRYGLKAIERFASSTHADFVVGSALPDERGEVRGAWLVAGSTTALPQGELLQLLSAAQPLVASTLGVLARAQPTWVHTLAKRSINLIRQHRGQAMLATVALVVALLFVPVPHRVKCDCQLEPVTRRFVAAPFAGPLKEALVTSGDMVRRGQLLARMDGREVRWELAGAQAELFRAAKERAGHVASHEAGAAVVARHEVDRLQYREQLLQARDQELDIRSPVDGMVVSGDLKEAEGMPLKVGEVLFEVAPLSIMIVELAVPEDDMKFIQSGMPVRVTFDAFPFRSYEAQVERIHPRAEIRDDQNVFIAEVRLDNPREALHPGMRGHARIDVGKATFGWGLLRRPLAAALEWLGW